MNPAGFHTTQAYGVSENTQVGGGGLNSRPNGGVGHALVWHGTAASAVDINPAGDEGSGAYGIDGDNVVGNATPSNHGDFYATLWTGPTHTVVNLQPTAFVTGTARAVWQNSQVGTGYTKTNFGGVPHALLWHGTAASVVDLSPPEFLLSEAYGVAGNLRVGYGSGSPTGGNNHALLWQGTAASVVDLHSFLTGLSSDFVSSIAQSVDASGRIVGFATDSNSVTYAVEWSPVPEPSSMFLILMGLMSLMAATTVQKSRPKQKQRNDRRPFARLGLAQYTPRLPDICPTRTWTWRF